MLSSRYAPAICVALLLVLVPTIIHSYAGLVVDDGRRTASIPATLSPLWVSLGVAISVGVGLFFGYYPADRAANLDPIVCLRYE